MIDTGVSPRELLLHALGVLQNEGRLPGFRIRRSGPALVRDRGAWRDTMTFQRSKYGRAGHARAWLHVAVSRAADARSKEHLVVGGNSLGRVRGPYTTMREFRVRSEEIEQDTDELGALVTEDALPFLDRFDDSLRFVETAEPHEITNLRSPGLFAVACQLERTDVLARYFQRRAHADPHGLMHVCRGLAAEEKGHGPVFGEAEFLRDQGLVDLIPERLRAGWSGDEPWPVGFLTRCPDLVVRFLHQWDLGRLADAAARLEVEGLREIERRTASALAAPSGPPPAGKALVLAICAELGADVDPATVWANGTVHYPPEHL